MKYVFLHEGQPDAGADSRQPFCLRRHGEMRCSWASLALSFQRLRLSFLLDQHSDEDGRPTMKEALKRLLDALETVFDEHEEVGDTDVKQSMYDAVHAGFFVPQPGYSLPTEFRMFSDEGNKKVRAALQDFLKHPDVLAAAKSLKTAEARLAAFQDGDVESREGNTYDFYFGYAEKP